MPTIYRIYPDKGQCSPNYTSNMQDAAFAAAKGKQVTKMIGEWESVEVALHMDGKQINKE